MALHQSTLLDRIRRFGDAEYSLFTGTPTSEDDARWKWATAFRDYVSAITPSAGTAAVDDAFYAKLRLALAFVTPPPASDFAAAWAAGMRSMTGIAAGWDLPMLGVRELALRARLQDLFSAPNLVAAHRLSEIASAFHLATVGMKSAATTPIIYG